MQIFLGIIARQETNVRAFTSIQLSKRADELNERLHPNAIQSLLVQAGVIEATQFVQYLVVVREFKRMGRIWIRLQDLLYNLVVFFLKDFK